MAVSVACMLLTCVAARAQDSIRTERRIWGDLSAGLGALREKTSSGSHSSPALTFGATAGYGPHVFAARYLTSNEPDPPSFGASPTPRERSTEIALLYGISGGYGVLRASVLAGLGFSRTIRRSQYAGDDGRTLSGSWHALREAGMCLPLETQLMLVVSPSVAIGVTGLYSVRASRDYGGLLLALHIGLFENASCTARHRVSVNHGINRTACDRPSAMEILP